MTYENFYITSDLSNLQAFRNLRKGNNKDIENIFAYNGTVTKCIMVSQPIFRFSILQADEDFFIRSVE